MRSCRIFFNMMRSSRVWRTDKTIAISLIFSCYVNTDQKGGYRFFAGILLLYRV